MKKVSFNSTTAELRDDLKKLEKKYKGDDSILGMTLLTRPIYISGSRTIMTTGHMKQRTCLKHPEFPRVPTGYEDMVGKYSSGIQRAKRNWVVEKKIYKFEENNHLYTLVVRDKDSGYYDVIQKKIVEDLTEKFGYKYNNEQLDTYEVGREIPKDEVMYKSTSYDEDNHYCMGVNATFCYTSDVRTTEDAILVSKSFQEKTKIIEVETIKVSINDNDVLLNLYGNEDNYKAFPDIGEPIDNKIVCATRRIHNDQLFYDFKESNLRKINFAEDVIYVEGNPGGKIVDIKVYSNKPIEEMEQNLYHEQLNKYYKNEMRYYQEIVNALEDIVKSNKPHSRNLNYLYKKAREILNPNVKWCEVQNKKPFSNIVMEFVVERETQIENGSKITGLFGNKGVTARVVPDDEMPILENGKRVDVEFNRLGVINRLNSFQLYEQSINFIMDRTVDRMKTLETNDQRAQLLFMMLKYFNEEQSDTMYGKYKKMSDDEKEDFMQDIYDKGVYVFIPPFWHNRKLFDVLKEIYAKHGDWLTPYQIYIKKNGRYRPVMTKAYIGEMYIIRLKQTASKGFSARSVGGVSLVGTPVKDAQAKENKILYPKTPCRLGLDEILNLLIATDPRELAKQNMSYRNSIEATRDLPIQLLKHGMVDKLRTDEDVVNRNVEVLNAYLKTMGYKLQPYEEMTELIYDDFDDNIKIHEYKGMKIECTDKEYINMVIDDEVNEILQDEIFIGTVDEYEERKEELRKKVRAKYED